MKTAAYTICKNEINRVEQWLHYTRDFDYRVILDTGSTDGTYEAFKKVPGIILDQQIISPYRFDIPRNLNLAMIPEDVEWALSPDLDEYFSINVLSEMQKTITQNPTVTNISCTRLDIYSDEVFVGPPNHIGSNKIHRRHDYLWLQPVYEYLCFKENKSMGIYENEVFNNNIYLVHDQEINKPRSTLYHKLMSKEYEENPTNIWNLWFLLNYYFKQKDLENFVDVGLQYVKCEVKNDKSLQVLQRLRAIANSQSIDNTDLKNRIISELRIKPLTNAPIKSKVIEHFYENIHGWFDFQDFYSTMVNGAVSPSHFVEVGSWKGKSTSYLAVEIINSGKDIKFDCVDTWEGSVEHQEGERSEDSSVIGGNLYNVFIENMSPVDGYYNPVRMTSLEAAKLYEDESLDFVFIDASHEYEDVKNDIIAWLPKVKSGGVLAGHDYPWESVAKAVHEVLAGMDVRTNNICWALKK